MHKKHKKHRKQPYKGSAKTLAAGLVCLASFVAPLASEAMAADDLTISGASGNGSDILAKGASFSFGTTSYLGNEGTHGSGSAQGAPKNVSWNGWSLLLGGGGGGYSGAGPFNGGNTVISTAGAVNANTVTLTSANGNRNDNAHGGELNFNAGALTANTVNITSGMGNNSLGTLNNGGAINFSTSVLSANTVNLTSGIDSIGGNGGAINFNAGTLNAHATTLTKGGGEVTVNIGSFNVSGASNTLVLDNTSAWNGSTGVAINGLSFAGNAGLEITSTNSGTATFKNLNINGVANTLNAPAAQLFGNINFAANSALSSTNALDFSTLNVYGQAQYTGALDATGKNLRFYLPATVAANDTMLTLTGSALDISGANIGVGIMGKGVPLAIGDEVTLIDATSDGLVADSTYTNTVTGMQGISKAYIFKLSSSNDLLLATVEDIRASDPAVRKSPAEGKAASVALVTQGADLAAGQGMFNARAAANQLNNGVNNGVKNAEGNGVAPAGNMGVGAFGAVSGGTSRYNTGSHVDVDSISLITGLAKTWQTSGMDILGGVFFETGFGSYNSYNSLEDGGSVKGDGDSRYVGGGILGRAELTESILRGLYAEASFRAGGMNVDYKSGALPFSDQRASYDANASYYGIHTGLGYIWLLTDAAMLDLYAKYFWNHTTAMDVTILDDSVHFKAVNSQRTRLGGRLTCTLNEYIAPYIGAAWEYEFDGKARSVVMGESAPAPALKGSTGVGELGLTWQPAPESAFSVDLGVQGYTGMREGVSGNVQLKFEF